MFLNFFIIIYFVYNCNFVFTVRMLYGEQMTLASFYDMICLVFVIFRNYNRFVLSKMFGHLANGWPIIIESKYNSKINGLE